MTKERASQLLLIVTLPIWIVPLVLVVALWPSEPEKIENDYLGNGHWGPIR